MERNLTRRSLLKGALAGMAGFAAAPLIGTNPNTTAGSGLQIRAFVPRLSADEPPSGSTSAAGKYLQGWASGTLGLAITNDGNTAYVSFSLDDSLLIVDLPTLTVSDSVDVSAAGSQLQSDAAMLALNDTKLYVSNPAAKNVMVIDTIKRHITKVLPIRPWYSMALTASPDGSKVYVPSSERELYIVSTANDSYQLVRITGTVFGPIAPSRNSPNLLYTVGTLITDQGRTFKPSFMAFNVSTQQIERSVSLASEVMPYPTTASRLILNTNETEAYFGWHKQGNDRDIGNLVTFDLGTFQVVASAPAENGVADFAVNEELGKIYVIGLWSGGGSSDNVPIVEWDIAGRQFGRNIPLSASSDQRAIAVDPAGADFLYETDGDHNLLRKVQISTGDEIGRLTFSKMTLRPRVIIRDGDTGYVANQASQDIYNVDLSSGEVRGKITIPVQFDKGWGFYQGNLYVSSGRSILAVDPGDGTIIERYRIGWDLHPHSFTFVDDRMVGIDYYLGGMIAKQLVVFDAHTMTLLDSIPLPDEPHGDKVVASSDGSKLYITRGPMFGGTSVVSIFDAATLDVINTIEIPPADQRRGATGFVEGEFDEANRILYLLGFTSVYKIDMDTDRLIGTLDLVDVFEAWGRRGWTPTGLSGISLSPSGDELLIASGDSHSLYSYDIGKSSWTARITNLQGYFITDCVASLDRHYFYTANSRSDSVTMVDLTSGDVIKVIDLHAYSASAGSRN